MISKVKEIPKIKIRLGQGRAGLRCKKLQITHPIAQSEKQLVKIPEISKKQNVVKTIPRFATAMQLRDDSCSKVIDRQMIQNANRKIPFNSDPVYRPPPKPVKIPIPKITGSTDIYPEFNKDFKENSPFQEGVILETYQRPDKSFIQEPQELESLINTGRLVQKFLPKQADIDRILKVIQKKVLKGTHLPVMIKEIQAGHLVSPYFKDIYLYQAHNMLPYTKPAI